ncbi:MAG: isoleucine--tRNA ligase [Spirochaetota bacterium]
MSYDSTLFLPNTSFPMRAGLTKKEPHMLERWDRQRIFYKVLEKRRGGPSFLLHDGPPYANGKIHIGTAYNKVMKDFIVKYKSMMGFFCPYVPGWDTHGLPIETEVLKAHKLNRDAISVLEFRKKCKEFTTRYIGTMTDQFKRLGVWGEWDKPYVTYHPQYEAKQIEVFGEMAKKGYIYKGLKPVYWCTTCVTALADAEVEYHDHSSPSIYATFPVKGEFDKAPGLEGSQVVIWTTTPWTLPGNTAVALHPDFEYTLFEADVSGSEAGGVAQRAGEAGEGARNLQGGGSRRRLLVAEELLEDFSRNTGVAIKNVIARYRGRQLEGVVLSHPFIDRDSPIVLADYVTLETGTGAVHTAPGHGLEDYETGRAYNLPVISPLDDQGRFTAEVPRFQGVFTRDANRLIIDHLREIGALLGVGELTHSYPHCWRCKNPVIFRATEQWFTSIDGFKKQALEAIDGVEWVPAGSINRIRAMVENRSDWCISRQRTWGVPLPIFYCDGCGREVINDVTLQAVQELFAAEGSDAWFAREAAQILPEGYRCPHCGGSGFTKEKDIMDVWFDSGTSHAAVLETREELYWPADLYIEGSDQHRGWFQSSLLTAVASRGAAPYRAVLTHGFTVDGEGKKMSKSLGNTVAPEEVIGRYGADIVRLWAVASDYAVDVRISGEILGQLVDSYRKVRNTIRFILGNLRGFHPGRDQVPSGRMEEIDRWLMHRLQQVTGHVLESYKKWQYHLIVRDLVGFCNIELSSFYLDIVKDRLYCSGPTLPRRSAQTALYHTLRNLLSLAAPVLAFTAEEAYGVFAGEVLAPAGVEAEESVHLTDFPAVEERYLDPALAADWNRLIAVRRDVLKPIEELRGRKEIGHSLEAEVALYADGELRELLERKREQLAPLFVVSGVELRPLAEAGPGAFAGETVTVQVRKSSSRKCERCWRYLPSVGRDQERPDLCGRCASVVDEHYAGAV